MPSEKNEAERSGESAIAAGVHRKSQMSAHESEVRAWVTELIQGWRAGWGTASKEVRDEVRKTFLSCEGPTCAIVYLRVDADIPPCAFGVELYETTAADDLRIDVIVVTSPVTEPWVPTQVERYWQNMRQNWSPGREPDPPLVPWAASMGPLDGSRGCFVIVPGGPRDLSVEALISHRFKPPSHALAPAHGTPTPRKHLYFHEKREDTAIERWLYGHADELMHALGVPVGPSRGWWCGMWLRRDEVFGDGKDGDVDLLAGPLTFDFDDPELRRRVQKEATEWPLATNRASVVGSAIMKAAHEGHVVWPPSTDTVVACEVKASGYSSETGLRNSHANEGRKVMAQLRYSLDHGIDRAALLHLCATRPRPTEAGNSWLLAGHDLGHTRASMPRIFEASEQPESGYFLGILGAVEGAEEHLEGASSGLEVLEVAAANPKSAPGAAWRDRLSKRLADLPRPTTLRAFVKRCGKCGTWRQAVMSIEQWSPCPCGMAGGAAPRAPR